MAYFVDMKSAKHSDHLAKFGYNSGVGAAGNPVEVWTVGGAYTAISLASASIIYAVSTSETDSGTSTGARTIITEGLDSNWNKFTTSSVQLSGSDSVLVHNSALRVFRSYVDTVGSSGTNSGDINLTYAGNDIAEIQAEHGQTLMAVYTVPNDYAGFKLTSWYCDAGRNATAAYVQMALQVRETGKAWRTKRLRTVVTTGGPMVDQLETPLNIPPKADIRVRVFDASASVPCAAGFNGFLYKVGE